MKRTVLLIMFISMISMISAKEYSEVLDTGVTKPTFELPENVKGVFSKIKIFQPSTAFPKSSSAFHLGLDALPTNNLTEDYRDEMEMKTIFSGINISQEKAFGNHIGVGLSLSSMMWKQPVFEYNYIYYAATLRVNYHFNANEKIDPYVGISYGYHSVLFWNKDYRESNGLTAFDYTLGCRYYPTKNFGLFAELGSDGISKFKIGISIRKKPKVQ